jgi:hypothetical protein
MSGRLEQLEIPVYSIREAADKLGKPWHYLAALIEDHRLPTYPMSTHYKARGLTLRSFLFLKRRIERSNKTQTTKCKAMSDEAMAS